MIIKEDKYTSTSIKRILGKQFPIDKVNNILLSWELSTSPKEFQKHLENNLNIPTSKEILEMFLNSEL